MHERGHRYTEQSITMTLVDGAVHFGAETELHISFRELMLRECDSYEVRERDIVFSQEELRFMATNIWSAQDEYEADKEAERQSK